MKKEMVGFVLFAFIMLVSTQALAQCKSGDSGIPNPAVVDINADDPWTITVGVTIKGDKLPITSPLILDDIRCNSVAINLVNWVSAPIKFSSVPVPNGAIGTRYTVTRSVFIPGSKYTCAAKIIDACNKVSALSNVPPLVMMPTVKKVELAWDQVTNPNVAGYRLHYGEHSGSYYSLQDVGNATTATVNLYSGKTYYFVVTDYYNSGQESGNSNEVSTTISP